MQNAECNMIFLRLFPKIDMIKIKEFFNSIPEEYKDISVFSKTKKELYYKVLEFRYNKLKNIYDLLLKKIEKII